MHKSITQLLQLACQTALRAGKEIMEVYETDFAVELKDDQSPVTLADKRASACIEAALAKTNIRVVCEEGSGHTFENREHLDSIWLVDPVDGTKEFVKRNGEFTVNIALIENSKAVIGVIYAPVLQLLYFAASNFGAWKMKVTTETSLPNFTGIDLNTIAQKLPFQALPKVFTLVGSRSHFSNALNEHIAKKEKEGQEVNIIKTGSSLKFCILAEGKAHEYARFGNTMEWDTAAGSCIINESGGYVYMLDSTNELEYNKPNLLNPEFVAIMTEEKS
jgi:3'(2'), 5'-bisphosphate nucleotidase